MDKMCDEELRVMVSLARVKIARESPEESDEGALQALAHIISSCDYLLVAVAMARLLSPYMCPDDVVRVGDTDSFLRLIAGRIIDDLDAKEINDDG